MSATPARLPIALALLLAGCAPAAKLAAEPPRGPTGTASVGSRPTAPAAGLISNKGGGLLAHDGGAITGSVRIPAGIVANSTGSLISNKGGGIVSNAGASLISNKGGGYRLAANGEAPAVGFAVTIVDARGDAVLDEAGKPYATATDERGGYRFARTPRGANLVLRVALPAEVGAMLAFLPDAPARTPRTAEVDAASTLELGYVLEKFVKVQPDPVAALQKLTASAEAEARAKAAAALAAGPPLTSFRPEPLISAVEALRKRDPAFDRQLEQVRRLLSGGLADVGDGEQATGVGLASPIALARLSDGSVLVAERNGHRIRRIDPTTGVITTLAGKNGGTEAGDGGLATDAFIDRPLALAVDRRDNVYVMDFWRRSVRRIDATTRVIETVAGLGAVPAATGVAAKGARLGQLYTIAIDAADRPVFCADDGVWRIEADGALTAIAQPIAEKAHTIVAGPGGVLHAFYREAGLIARLQGDALVPLADAPRLPVAASRFGVGEARFALGEDGRAFVLDAGKVWTLPPGGGWSELPFTTPHGELWAVLPLTDGLLLADGERNRVWKLPLGGGEAVGIAGLAAVTADELAAEALTLNRPTQLLVDARGDLLVADALNNVVWRRLPDGRFRRWAGGEPATPSDTAIGDGGPAREARLLTVFNLTLLGDGTVLIGEAGPPVYRLRAVAPDGTISTRAVPAALPAPAFMAETPDGAVLVSDYLHRKVFRWKGESVEPAVKGPGIRQPGQIIVRPEGGFLVADAEGCAVWQVVDGVPTKLVGGNGPGFAGDGGPAAEAKLNNPAMMVRAANGDLYISDLLNDRVRRVRAATGKIETIAGAGGKLLAGSGPDDSLKEPAGLAFDHAGNLWVADSGHNQVKRLDAGDLE